MGQGRGQDGAIGAGDAIGSYGGNGAAGASYSSAITSGKGRTSVSVDTATTVDAGARRGSSSGHADAGCRGESLVIEQTEGVWPADNDGGGSGSSSRGVATVDEYESDFEDDDE